MQEPDSRVDDALDELSGQFGVRIAFAEPANKPGDLRGATVELARRARGEAGS